MDFLIDLRVQVVGRNHFHGQVRRETDVPAGNDFAGQAAPPDERGVRLADALRIVGDDPADMTASGLWPSDHAGVVAKLVFPERH